ncbi:hypothetical protein CBL_08713 [Carabus blaptoides fortunei]
MTSLIDETFSPTLASADEAHIKKEKLEIEDPVSNDSLSSSSSDESLQCRTCQIDYKDREQFYVHLLEHVTKPRVVVQRIDDLKAKDKIKKSGPLRFTVRTKNNNFKIVKSPEIIEQTENKENNQPRIPKLRILLPEQVTEQVVDAAQKESNKESGSNETNDADENEKEVKSPKQTEEVRCNGDTPDTDSKMVELHTLPNESQSPSFPSQSPGQPEVASGTEQTSLWHDTEPGDDSLRIRESGEKEAETHNNLLQNFLNDTADNTPKDSGINSNDTEYISLDRLAGPRCPVCGERCLDQFSLDVHQKAMGHYLNSNNLVPYSQSSLPSLQANTLDSLANLPMQQLAQQVNRLQQGGVHQQNVLINIQQFGQAIPPPPQYGRAPEIPSPYGPQQHYPPRPQAPPPPPPHMYGGYPPPHHPAHPMYYPPGAGMYPPMAHDRNRPHQLRMPMSAARNGPPRPSNPRPPMPPGMRSSIPQQGRPMKRPSLLSDQQQQQAVLKRKRLDVLIPDTNDNDDCHVISMQKCNDGMPVIKNVQGASMSDIESDPIVHLTDSITLSVRNPKEAPVVQKKSSDAKSVANILATRGITVTPAAKNQKDAPEPKRSSQSSNSPPIAINLNNAVSIIPTARTSNVQNQAKSNQVKTPTVDLTDDEPVQPPPKPTATAGTASKRALPHQCDLCPAQYPTMQSLINHRRVYHKTGPHSELGVPVVDLKQPAVLSKLSSLGINNYIPLPQLGTGGSTFGLPIVSVNASRNPNICNINALGSGAVLPLGPLRHISNLSKQ